MQKYTPTIIENLPSLRTSDLKWHTYSNQSVRGLYGSLKPYRLIYTLNEEGLTMNFDYRGKREVQFISIVFVTSNLGNGKAWYFECPVSGKRCRKLVLVKGKFMHQSCIANAYYKQQTESVPKRTSMKWIRRYQEYQSLLKRQMSPYYKPTYAGNSTRLAVRSTKALDRYAAALNNKKEVWMWIEGTRNIEKKI